MRAFHLALIAAALAVPGVAVAQTVTDQKVWIAGEGRAELTPALRLALEQQLRLGDSGSSFEQTFTELGLRYRIAKPFRVGGFYRAIFLDGETRHRLGADGDAQLALGRAELAGRLRLQHTLRDAGGETVVRPRLKLSLDAPHRLTPYVAAELFYSLDRGELRERRLSAGLGWEITKRIELTGFYLYQHEDRSTDEQAHVVGFGVVWTVRTVDKPRPRSP